VKPLILTHTGKLGDFVYSWPVAEWVYRQTGRKIHWVLPRCFKPFQQVERLLALQDFTDSLTLVDFPVKGYNCGGQPYRFNPADYGIPGEYYNLGFRWWPTQSKKFVTEFMGEEHGFGWDPNWVLKIGDYSRVETFSRVYTEQFRKECVSEKNERVIDLNRDILDNVQMLAAAKTRHCAFSGMAAILYFARVPFTLYRSTDNPATPLYFPDTSRYELIITRPPYKSIRTKVDLKKDLLKTNWELIKTRMISVFRSRVRTI